MGIMMGLYVAFMTNISKKLRIQISILPTVALLMLAMFYMSYDFLDIHTKKALGDFYKFFLNNRHGLFVFGGMSLGMLGRWKKMELCPYQLLRLGILGLFPLITIGLLALRVFMPAFSYPIIHVLWGLQVTIYVWMSLRLTIKNQKILCLGHGLVFGGMFSLLYRTGVYPTQYGEVLSIWGLMSLVYYFSKKFIMNSHNSVSI